MNVLRASMTKFVSLAALCLVMARPAASQPLHSRSNHLPRNAQGLLENTDTFRIAFGMSFGIDKCGDYRHGKVFRQAVIARMHSCPFSIQARKDFDAWTRTMEDKLSAVLGEGLAGGAITPDAKCGLILNDPKFLTEMAALDRLGPLIWSERLDQDPCDTPPVAP